jgi:GTPase SAR1 family protein
VSGLRDGVYNGAKAAIIMFDYGSSTTLRDCRMLYRAFASKLPEAPIVLVGNKVGCEKKGDRDLLMAF